MTMKKLTAVVAILATLSACASQANVDLLASYERGCAMGDQRACAVVPFQKQKNQEEAQENAGKALAIGLLLPLVVIAAAAEANQPRYVVVARPRHYWH